MLKRLLLVGAIGATTGLTACQSDDSDTTYRSSRAGETYSPSASGNSSDSSATYGTSQNDPANRRGTTLTADARFLNDAAVGGLMEVRLGQLASQRGQSQEVKQFARRLADDHTRANNELKQIVSAQNIALPTRLDPQHQQMVDRLAGLNGQEFDRAFIREAIDHHHRAIAKFEQQSTGGSDQRVRDFASRTLPKLREHLRMAQDIAGRLGIDAGRSSSAGASSPDRSGAGSDPDMTRRDTDTANTGTTNGGGSAPSKSGGSSDMGGSGTTNGGTDAQPPASDGAM